MRRFSWLVLALTLATVEVRADEKTFDVPATAAIRSIPEFARQAQLQVVAPADELRGVTTPAVKGKLDIRIALKQLLIGTGLEIASDDGEVIILKRVERLKSSDTFAVHGERARMAEAGGADRSAERNGRDESAHAAAASVPSRSAQVEEIVVTATRRAESAQTIPLSVTAIDTKGLEAMGATGFEGFASTVPGLTFNQTNPSTPVFVIRGVSTQNIAGNTQLPVATYIDDMPSLASFAATVAPDLRLFDIERVEVLRGPQGTLFGSGALGGAIRVLTNKPDPREFASKVELTGLTTREGGTGYAANGMLNVPLVEGRLAVRAVAYDAEDAGYVDNIVRQRMDTNEIKTRGGRLQIEALPTENLILRAGVIEQERDITDAPFVLQARDSLDFDGAVRNGSRSRLTNVNLTAIYDFGFASLTSSANYARTTADNVSDVTPFVPLGVPLPDVLNDRSRYSSAEVRFASQGESALGYVIGGFYLERSRTFLNTIEIPGLLLAREDNNLPATEAALYGELSYSVLPQLKLTAGARAFRDTSSQQPTTSGLIFGGTTVVSRKFKTRESAATPKFAATWTPTRDLTVYVQAAEGYRVGQANPPDPLNPQINGNYGPDSLWNYETGVKAYLFDRHMHVDAAAYYIDWRDIQINVVSPDGFNHIANAGHATSQGFELSVGVQPTESFAFSSALSYTDASMAEDAPGLGARRGDRLPGSSKFQIASALTWQVPLTPNVRGSMRLEHQYIGSILSDINNQAAYEYGDYHVLNLRLGAQYRAYELVLFVDNLADSRAVVSGFGGPGYPAPFAVRLRPQTLGVTLRAAF